MKIKELLIEGSRILSPKQNASPQLDAEVLLCAVLKKDKTYLFTHYDKSVSTSQAGKFIKLIDKRTEGYPVAYLTRNKSFYGYDFFVNEDVLIPRPETETLVELVLSQLSTLNSKLSILDLGTGSGNIIISLAKNLHHQSFPRKRESRNWIPDQVGDDNIKFFASDISKKALAVAKQNAKKHKISIKFKHGDLLTPWEHQQFDIIVANLPYLSKEVDESTKFEPKKALIAKKKGLALYEKLFKQLSLRGRSDEACLPVGRQSPKGDRHANARDDESSQPKLIAIEIDPSQKSAIKKLAKKYLPEYTVEVKKDLAGKNRFAIFERAQRFSEV